MERQVFTPEMFEFEDKLLPTVLDNTGLKILKDRIVVIHLCSLLIYTSQSIKDRGTRKSKETASMTTSKLVFYPFAQAIKKWKYLEKT